MKRLRIPVLISLASATTHLAAQQPAAPQGSDPLTSAEWPQVFETSNGLELAVHQPQVAEWPDYRRIVVRAAVALKPKDAPDDAVDYGALTLSADTAVDQEKRLVILGDRKIESLQFPNVEDEATAARYRAGVVGAMNPTRPLTLSLDLVLANAERSERQRNVSGISVEPPPIFFSSEPAILVIFLGPPQFEQVPDSPLFFAANTNWDVLLDPATSTYYLLNDGSWLTTRDVMNGPWSATTELPASVAQLPTGDDWSEVLAALPPSEATGVRVFVSDQPAELILTDGRPAIAPIPGTPVFYLANSDSDVLMVNGRYYFLSAGRWFSAANPAGPWEAAMDAIPREFAAIPGDHDKAHVLASVPGTPDAEEAVIAAQVPQTATVNRNEVTVEVKYEGTPQFNPIETTQVQYATNTPNDVFLVAPNYYCCHQGVWFQSTTANGPWVVCTDVPDEIYTIPASSPKHNVTYVYVYDSTPETVTVGHTSGYSGAYILGDLLVFGAGLWLASEIIDNWDDHYHSCHWHYHACHWSYGCGARYSWHHGGYYSVAHRAYGPYGGAGHGAVYNPWTGGYARGGHVYGPRGAAFGREAYNPWTNTYGARVGVSTPYGSWGRSAVVRGDDWVRAGYRSDARGSARAFETSEGAAGVRVDRRFGSDGFVGKSKNDDLYVGRDGNVYRRDAEGGWDSVHKSGQNPRTTVQPATSPQRPTRQPVTTQPTTSRTTGQPLAGSANRTQPATTSAQLQRDFSARQRATTRSTQAPNFPARSGGGRTLRR